MTKVTIGSESALAGVDRDSLSFCFQALVQDTDLASARLAIEGAARDELDITWLELEE
jgi:Zn finger protein HypA/HybF involved in hydrogenase expression